MAGVHPLIYCPSSIEHLRLHSQGCPTLSWTHPRVAASAACHPARRDWWAGSAAHGAAKTPEPALGTSCIPHTRCLFICLIQSSHPAKHYFLMSTKLSILCTQACCNSSLRGHSQATPWKTANSLAQSDAGEDKGNAQEERQPRIGQPGSWSCGRPAARVPSGMPALPVRDGGACNVQQYLL